MTSMRHSFTLNIKMSQESLRSSDGWMDERGGFIDSQRLLVCLVKCEPGECKQ